MPLLPIAILGGGPIGLVCALMLARAGIACEMIDARPIEALQRDRRLLALSRGSLLVLESLLGPDFAPMAAIERVLVSSQGDAGVAQLGLQDFPGTNVGATLWYADLVTALANALQTTPERQRLIRVRRPSRVARVDQQRDRVRITLDDGAALEAQLAIDAEGTPASAPQAKDFALLADIELSFVAPGDAIERFTREGPLALLPLPPAPSTRPPAAPRGAGPRVRMSMIWCQPAEQARLRLQMPQDLLCVQIAGNLGPRLGRPTVVGPRNIFPLTTHRLEQVCEHRLVHIGNAAQSLHPVAGQGFNLGIRDCACLVESLIDLSRLHPTPDSTRDSLAQARAGRALEPEQALAWDPIEALAHYRRRRQLDRRLLPALTSALPSLFASNLVPVAAARSVGLIALDAIPALRRAFTRLLMFGPG